MEVLWLSGEEVDKVGLTIQECLHLVNQVLRWQAEGCFEAPIKLGIHPPKGRHIHAMPALVPPMAAAGVKWIADFSDNEKLGLPTLHSVLILNSMETGAPLCVMEGGRVTAMRTAAMTCVSLLACAIPAANALTIVGTGTQARAHAVAVSEILPGLTTIRVVGRHKEMAVNFSRELEKRVYCKLIPEEDRENAVRQADIVVTVTNSVNTRLLEPEWLKPGVTAVVLDNGGKETTISHCMDRVFVDDRRAFATDEAQRRFSSGVPCIDGELSEILVGRLNGRRNAQERILVLNLGIAACDIVVASEVFRRASKMGFGRLLTL